MDSSFLYISGFVKINAKKAQNLVHFLPYNFGDLFAQIHKILQGFILNFSVGGVMARDAFIIFEN